MDIVAFIVVAALFLVPFWLIVRLFGKIDSNGEVDGGGGPD